MDALIDLANKTRNSPNIDLDETVSKFVIFHNFITATLSRFLSDSEILQLKKSDEFLKTFNKIFTSESIDPENNYQLFEFQGDGLLHGIVPGYLLKRFPDIKKQGIFTRIYSNLTCKKRLGNFAIKLGFDRHLRATEDDLKISKISILEDTFEAFIGGVYSLLRNVGIPEAYEKLAKFVEEILDEEDINPGKEGKADPITRLKEVYDKMCWKTPDMMAPEYVEMEENLENLADYEIGDWKKWSSLELVKYYEELQKIKIAVADTPEQYYPNGSTKPKYYVIGVMGWGIASGATNTRIKHIIGVGLSIDKKNAKKLASISAMSYINNPIRRLHSMNEFHNFRMKINHKIYPNNQNNEKNVKNTVKVVVRDYDNFLATGYGEDTNQAISKAYYHALIKVMKYSETDRTECKFKEKNPMDFSYPETKMKTVPTTITTTEEDELEF